MVESHPFQMVRIRVNAIERHFTREENPEIGKPDHNDEESWRGLWSCLVSAKKAIDNFFHTGGFLDDMNRVKNFFEYESYLRKIESFANDIQVLLKAANSPRCYHLFTFEFNVRALAKQASEADNVPETSKQWETVLEKALTFRNYSKDEEQEDFLIDIKKVKKDTAYLASGGITRNLVVHCEVKILTDIFATETKITGTPKAYTYIGVSKLSCRGCQAFLKSFNAVHHTNFTTKGSHSKSHWPWQFPPQPFAKSDEVLSLTYRVIAHRWVQSYSGYTLAWVPFGPDSEAQSGTRFSDADEDEDALADLYAQKLHL